MPPQKTLPELLEDLRAEPRDPGVLQNVIDDMMVTPDVPEGTKATLPDMRVAARSGDANRLRGAYDWVLMELETLLGERAPLRRAPRIEIPPLDDEARRRLTFDGGRRRSQSKKFGSCVKAVRKTVKARKGSTAEGAAIAICTKSMLFPRGRTLKRYRKGRLLTQKRRR